MHLITHSKTRKGFTLVEIMVVVFIIAVILTIAVPVFANRRREARYTMVIGDLKAIESAKSRYMMDRAVPGNTIPATSDLTPDFLAQWPTGPFHNGADYSPNSVSSAATFKGLTLDNLISDKDGSCTTLGL